MILTDSQVEYIKARTSARLGTFVSKTNKNNQLLVAEYTCPCGHTEQYLLYAECPVCFRPIEFKGYIYRYSNQQTLADELGVDSKTLNKNLAVKSIPLSRVNEICRILGITREELKDA